jgi:hypothetical protein
LEVCNYELLQNIIWNGNDGDMLKWVMDYYSIDELLQKDLHSLHYYYFDNVYTLDLYFKNRDTSKIVLNNLVCNIQILQWLYSKKKGTEEWKHYAQKLLQNNPTLHIRNWVRSTLH